MAGIGFSLRHLLNGETYASKIQAYSYAGLLSAGPWVFSIIGILLLSMLSLTDRTLDLKITEFQTLITYLIASSLIFSSLLQLVIVRYIADLIYLKKDDAILPNINGALVIILVLSYLVISAVTGFIFSEQDIYFKLLINSTFTLLCGVWICTLLMLGLHNYKAILILFFLAYGMIVILGLLLNNWGMHGLLVSFLTGQLILLLGMMLIIFYYYPSTTLICFDFCKRHTFYFSLLFIGVIYNLAVWADKFIFWYHPETSQASMGLLRASLVYDLPIFLAYLAIVPGMAVFLIHIETNFSERCRGFYQAILQGESLKTIIKMRNLMVESSQRGLIAIAQTQMFVFFILLLSGHQLLTMIGISTIYLHLFYVDVVGTSLQMFFLGILNILFYLDKRKYIILLLLLLLISNVSLSWLSIYLGPFFYGYGFSLAFLITVIAGMILLNRSFDKLEYKTFMFN